MKGLEMYIKESLLLTDIDINITRFGSHQYFRFSFFHMDSISHPIEVKHNLMTFLINNI